jgi:hypothetical protein
MKTILRSAGLAAILLTVGMSTARGAGCLGTCTVSCDSGATYYYYEQDYRCCARVNLACPDGSSAYGTEWWPATCGYAQIC